MTSYKATSVILSTVLSLYSCGQAAEKKLNSSITDNSPNARIQLIQQEDENKIDILIDGEHFTSYLYPETLKKPVLYPIKTAKGTFITRGFPLANRPGERVDHPHQVGLWFNYGDVNGLDFWNNSNAIAEEKKDRYGSIIHRNINLVESGKEEGKLVVAADWVDIQGNVLLEEETSFLFRGSDTERVIDRTTVLTAPEQDISFTDNKEGMLGIRMTRELEHPSDKAEKLTDANGIPSEMPSLNNEGLTGMYQGSNGLTGDDVWGTRAEWVNLSGEIKGEKISVAILDHPQNVGHPTYWHARGYGLFAANPLGQKAMSGGKEELNYQLKAGESVTFKYRIIVYSGDEVNDEQVNSDFEEYAGKLK